MSLKKKGTLLVAAVAAATVIMGAAAFACTNLATLNLSSTAGKAGDIVTVTGERKERERVGILRRRTRTVGRFRYEVLLPGEVEEDGVAASLHEGVLTVRVPKPARERPRRIPVTHG